MSLLEQVQANPVRGSTAAHLYVFYLSWRLWEVHLCGFYVSGRLRGGTDSDDLWDRVGQGDFSPALDWLRTKVHTRGNLVDAPQVFADAVGQRDPVADLMDHLRSRHGALVGL